MDKILSIVIPTYNMEKYLRKCLDSLIVQDENMEKLEVLVINDGSKDSSSQIAHEYEARYPNTFKVIDKENGGHGSAWNKGVELTTGKYIRFLDSDDWLTNLEDFISALENYDVDLVFTGLRVTFEKSSRSDRIYKGSGMIANTQYDVDAFDWKSTNSMFLGHNITNFHMCTYRAEMLKNEHPVFFEKMFYDDEILFVLPLCFGKTFVYFDLILYNYLLGREGQTMDIKIQTRNIGFKIKIRQYETMFYKEHAPESKSVDEKLKYILNSRHNNTFLLMLALPYKDCIKRSSELKSWLTKEFPSFKGDIKYKLYRFSPYCCWLAYNFLNKLRKLFT